MEAGPWQTNPVQTNPVATPSMKVLRRGRFWAVHDGAGQLVCLTVFKKGAAEVVRRLSGLASSC